MRKLIEIILIIFIFNSFCIAQEIDSLDIQIELGVDSLYNLQLELKSKQGTLSDCDFAIENAERNFKANHFTLHSNAFSGNCSYCAVLGQNYNINWRFTNDLFPHQYYRDYDSIMTKLLKNKYGDQFLDRARELADSLDNTENWITQAKFPGGDSELLKFIMSRLTIDCVQSDDIKTKIFVQFDIDTAGKVINPIVRRGINKEIDDKVVSIINQLPDWIPGYLYGKPIRITYTMPIIIDFK